MTGDVDALVRELLSAAAEKDDRRRRSVVRGDLLPRALSHESSDVRLLALQVAALDPVVVETAWVAGLLDDPDIEVRRRALELVGELADPDAVDLLSRRLREETADDLIDATLRCLARSTARNRPLEWRLGEQVRRALEALPDGVARRHEVLVDAVAAYLNPSEAVSDEPSSATINLVDTEELASLLFAEEVGVELVLPEAFGALSGNRAVRRAGLETIVTLDPEDVHAWLRDELHATAPADLAAFAARISQIPGADLMDELATLAVTLPPGSDRDGLILELRTSESAWALVAKLQSSPNAEERLFGLHLSAALDRSHTEGILLGLSDSAPSVRLAATEFVSGPLSDELTDRLVDVLTGDPVPSVRLAAARALASAGPDARLRAAGRAATSDEASVRTLAVGLLVEPGQDELAQLARALDDPADEVVSAAVRVLVEHHPHVAPTVFVETLRRLGPERHETLVECADQLPPRSLLPAVRRGLASDRVADRATAIQLAARNEAVVEVLDELHLALADPAIEVRMHAVEALGAAPSEVRVDVVGACLGDPAAAVRSETVRLLRRVTNDAAVPLLLRAAGDPTDHVRAQAIEALRDRSGPGLVEQLLLAMRDPATRPAARSVLVELDHIGLDALIDRLDESDEPTRREIGIVLEQSGRLDGLVAMLEHRDPERRRRAVAALGAAMATGAVPDLARRLEDPVAAVRREAARVLARIGDQRAVDALRQAILADPDPLMIDELESALRQIEPGRRTADSRTEANENARIQERT